METKKKSETYYQMKARANTYVKDTTIHNIQEIGRQNINKLYEYILDNFGFNKKFVNQRIQVMIDNKQIKKQGDFLLPYGSDQEI